MWRICYQAFFLTTSPHLEIRARSAALSFWWPHSHGQFLRSTTARISEAPLASSDKSIVLEQIDFSCERCAYVFTRFQQGYQRNWLRLLWPLREIF
jgi:hypothetical protein